MGGYMSDAKQATGKTSTSKTKSGKVIPGSETDVQEVVDEKMFKDPPCNVGVSVGFTRNMGNYESMKFQVSINIPCAMEDVDEAYIAGKEWVEERVNKINDDFDGTGSTSEGDNL
jgi:hypothetical protein